MANSELDTDLVYCTLHTTARVGRNSVSRKVLQIERTGGKFEQIRHLVASQRGLLVYGRSRCRYLAGGVSSGLDPRRAECVEVDRTHYYRGGDPDRKIIGATRLGR